MREIVINQILSTSGGRAVEVPTISTLMSSIKNCSILDVGCVNRIPSINKKIFGTFKYCISLKNLIYGIDMVDPSEIEPNEHMHYSKMDARKMDFNTDNFDHVLCISVIEHIGMPEYGNDPEGDIKAIKEIYRVLKKGGSLIISFPFGKEGTYFSNLRSYHIGRRNRLIYESGFHTVSEWYFKRDGQVWYMSTYKELADVKQYQDGLDINGLMIGVWQK